jgi:hypothetical protein
VRLVRRHVLVAAIAAAAIAIVWWSWGRSTPAPASADPADVPNVLPPPGPAIASPAAREEPPPAAAALDEPTREQWEVMQRTLGVGEIEVLVLRGKEPQRGARVRVWEGDFWLASATGRGPALRECHTGADGRAVLRDLAGGGVSVRADLGGSWLKALAIVAAPGASHVGRTIVLRFGDATIAGTVRDEAGAPHAGVPVHVVGMGATHAVIAVTDESGGYEVGGLCGGRYHVQLAQQSDPARWSAANERMLTLRAGARARMDFGGPVPAGSVRGRIVDAEGAALLGERVVRLRHVVHNDERRARVEATGEFLVPLPPGRWEVLIGDWFADEVLATVDVESTETRATIRWPGVRVVAIVHAPDDVNVAALRGCLGLLGASGYVEPEGAFAVDGELLAQWTRVPEGRYELWVGNGLFFTDAPNGVRVNVPSAGVQRLHVHVRR